MEEIILEDKSKAKTSPNEFVFVIAMWLVSRLIIVVAMQLIAPALNELPVHGFFRMSPTAFFPNFVPHPGWELFAHWDGAFYRQIATLGYDYAEDGRQHSVAFFPLFPLLTRGVMFLGLRFEVAGTVVNNLAFLGALLLLYRWVKERHSISAARWATVVLAWCPFSLYGTVIYTEGLFLLLTTAALQAFDKRQHAKAALWGAMATATRVTGLALVPTFLFVAWRERRPIHAYAAGLAAGLGLLLFSIYCTIRFGDALAWVRVQQAWHHPSWWNTFVDVLRFKRDSLNRIIYVLGGIYLLWYSRRNLPRVAVVYGFCSFGLILSSGALVSVSRFTYAIVSLSFALGILLSRYPRWGYALVGLFTILLVSYAIRFAWWVWVA